MIFALAACQETPQETPNYEPCIAEDPNIRYYNYSGELPEVTLTKEGRYQLWQDKSYMPYDCGNGEEEVPSVEAYLVESDTPTGCIIVSSGGGYVRLNTQGEGEPIAKLISETYGISVFVLHYRIAPNNYKAILSDQLRAIRFVRFFADDFNVDPDHIAVMGFSAGGHLTLMASEHYDYGKVDCDNIDAISSRPDATILSYPGTTSHEGAFLEGESTEELVNHFDENKGIRLDMPPVFVVHCKDDTITPIEGSYNLVAALEEQGVSCTYHWYKRGGHGFGIGSAETGTNTWTQKLAAWLTEQGFPSAKSE